MKYFVEPIAFVKGTRNEIKEDNWDSYTSYIELADGIPENSLAGIHGYSHLEVIFLFDKILDDEVTWYGHPRENSNWPLTGIFATRKKDRPNHIGLTTVEFVKHEGRKIFVNKLDALDGTPILDIKPVWKTFLPKAEVKQPVWVDELSRNYW